MTNPAIISLAILKVNWDILKKGYLENFIPFVAECIRRSEEDVISLPNLQNNLRDFFGMELPQNVIDAILKKARNQGYIKLENRVYKRNLEKLTGFGFSDIQQQVLRMHESLVKSLIEFCSKSYNESWSEEDAENALQSYIQRNQFIITCAATQGTVIPTTKRHHKRSDFLVGAFVQHLQETYSADFNYIETVVKGNMLANAIFLPDPNQASRNFRNTDVYFDTQFLMFALGYAGYAQEAPCSELLELLYETGANLRCFQHTIEEIKGILDACSSRIVSGQIKGAWGPSEYFILRGYTASDIELLSIRLEKDLEKLRIHVVEKPSYMPKHYVIDEKGLAKALNDYMTYKNPKALDRDVDSISAIMRLREEKHYPAIEECRALFVTTNYDLARISRQFYYKESNFHTVCPCLTDGVLTNLLWLKKPTKAPDLPRKRIIADCYAATQPSEHLWNLYLTEMDKLEQDKQITPDEYYSLRHSLEAKSALMELTHGEEEGFTRGTVQEILELVRSRIQAEVKAELESEKKLREETEQKLLETQQSDEQVRSELESEKKRSAEAEEKFEEALVAKVELLDTVRTVEARESARITYIEYRAQRYANVIAKLVFGFVLFLLAVGAVSTFPWSFPKLTSEPFRYLASILQVILIVGSFLHFVTGITLKTYLRRFEVILSKWILRKFLKLSGLNKQELV